MRKSLRGAIAAGPAVMLAITAGCAFAQQDRTLEMSPADLIQAFVGDAASHGQRDPGVSSRIYHVLAHPGAYGHVRLSPFLDQLEELAMNHPSQHLAAEAAYALSVPGTQSVDAPMPGTVERLVAVYRRTQYAAVRAIVVGAMIDQAERAAAMPFLDSVAAMMPDRPGPDLAQGMAIFALASMGDQGRRALRRLHEAGAVRDLEARYQLEVIAGKGYRVGD